MFFNSLYFDHEKLIENKKKCNLQARSSQNGNKQKQQLAFSGRMFSSSSDPRWS